jgi:head-tail adaptor
MIDPGRLKTRLQIQSPVETGDGQGGVVRSFATLATVWAQVAPLAARGGAGVGVEADAEGATVKTRILLRSNFSLTLQHRLVDGARIYRISAIRDAGDRRFIAVDAELRVE